MSVKKIFLVMGKTPLRHNRTAARHYAGNTFCGERNVAQQYTGVNGEVIHALLGLFDEGVAEEFPRQVFGAAIDFSSA